MVYHELFCAIISFGFLLTVNLTIANLQAVTFFNRIVESKIFLTLINGNIMTSKIVLTTTGKIMLLHGLLFFFGA